jgi:hypothetical protein
LARKREQKLNDRIMAALRTLDPRRCENVVDPGTPDIHYIGGWIEDKSIAEWPKRPATVVAVDHYVPGQRGWHVRRRAAGGRVHVAFEVGGPEGCFMLFDASRAAEHLGIDWKRQDCLGAAEFVCAPWDGAALLRHIQRLDSARWRS